MAHPGVSAGSLGHRGKEPLMSHGLRSMQRQILQTVQAILAEPTMGLFGESRAACPHQPTQWYLTLPGAATGTCVCRVVHRSTLMGRLLYARHQAGEGVTEAVHQASYGRALLSLVRAGHLRQVWRVRPYATVRCPDCGRLGPHPLHPRHCARTQAVTLPDYIQVLLADERV
jgi:hypothetical protein